MLLNVHTAVLFLLVKLVVLPFFVCPPFSFFWVVQFSLFLFFSSAEVWLVSKPNPVFPLNSFAFKFIWCFSLFPSLYLFDASPFLALLCFSFSLYLCSSLLGFLIFSSLLGFCWCSLYYGWIFQLLPVLCDKLKDEISLWWLMLGRNLCSFLGIHEVSEIF